jgi:hypothetical protein
MMPGGRVRFKVSLSCQQRVATAMEIILGSSSYIWNAGVPFYPAIKNP